MKKVILFGILIFTAATLTAQTDSDSIQIKKRFGTVFLQNGKYLRPAQLMNIMQTNPEAAKEMKLAKSNYDVGYIFGFAGGFLIGWPIGTSLAGGDPNWTLAYVGAGLAIISIPFSVSYTKHAKNAVNIYNSGLKTSYLPKTLINLRLSANCVVFNISF